MKSVTEPEVAHSADESRYQPAKQHPVTPRAVVIGILAALAMCAVMPYNDYFIAATYLSGNWFPIGGIAAMLVVVLAVNPLLIRLNRPADVFTPSELMTIWSLVVVVAGIPSSGLMRYLIPHMIGPLYYANAQNGWYHSMISHMPSRLMVTDPEAIRAFFEGLKRGESIPWGAWLQPLGYWAIFVAFLYMLFFSIAGVVRKQWVENERYAFPLVRLASMMAQAPERGKSVNSFLREPLLWSAVALVTVLHTIKGLHLFYPSIPDIPTSFHSYTYITSPPMNAINDTVLAIFPLVIGLSYLLASDVCLSLWLFYVVFKIQVLIGTTYSWDMAGTGSGIAMGPAFVTYQEAGGTAMLVVWLLWSMRGHLRDVWRKAVLSDASVDDSAEAMPYRTALGGFFVSVFGLFLWLTLVAGIAPALAFGMVLGCLSVVVLLSWMVAQAGVLFMQQSFSPVQITATLIGKTVLLPAPTLASAMQVEHVGWFDARELMLPSIMNAQKGADDTGLSPRSLMKVMAATVALAVVVSAIASIWLPYTHGGGTALKNTWMYVSAPQQPFTWAASNITGSSQLTPKVIPNALGGAVIVAVLFMARAATAAFPLSPAGFLIAGTYPMYMLWFSTLLGWAIKLPILKYGGMNGYRQMLPFFLGLILGDTINAVIWTIVGFATHTGYSLLPG